MCYKRLPLGVLFLVCPVWGALPLPPPEVLQPKVVSLGEDVCVPSLPWRWVTWNLQWFPGNRPAASETAHENHIRAVGRILQKIGPQVVVLQEVLDPVALREATPKYAWRVLTDFPRAADEDEKLPPQNIALVSQWPWKEIWEIDFHGLPLTPDRPVRGFLGSRFQDDLGRSITVYGVHLKSNRGGKDASAARREKAMDYLRWDWRRRGLDPARDQILVVGDFNCSTRNPEFNEKTVRDLLKEGWSVADACIGWPEGATVKADSQGRYPAVDFDHFLLSPGLVGTWQGRGWQIKIDSTGEVPSDHYPVNLVFPPWKSVGVPFR